MRPNTAAIPPSAATQKAPQKSQTKALNLIPKNAAITPSDVFKPRESAAKLGPKVNRQPNSNIPQ